MIVHKYLASMKRGFGCVNRPDHNGAGGPGVAGIRSAQHYSSEDDSIVASIPSIELHFRPQCWSAASLGQYSPQGQHSESKLATLGSQV